VRPREHNWQWEGGKWSCADCGLQSECTCKPTDPGPYHVATCPRRAHWDSLPGYNNVPECSARDAGEES
jgi:hypothetical protein